MERFKKYILDQLYGLRIGRADLRYAQMLFIIEKKQFKKELEDEKAAVWELYNRQIGEMLEKVVLKLFCVNILYYYYY